MATTEKKLLNVDPITETLISVNPDDVVDAPGEFFVSVKDQLLKKAHVFSGVSNDVIEGYNNLVKYSIKKMIKTSKIRVKTKAVSKYYTRNNIDYSTNKSLDNQQLLGKLSNKEYKRELYLVFTEVKYLSPQGEGRPLFPYDFRLRKKSYMAEVQVKLGVEIRERGKETVIYNLQGDRGQDFLTIGKIPIMTGSILDNIVIEGITDKNKHNYGEDPEDPQAQFIIGGNTYVIFLKDVMRQNRIFNYSGGAIGPVCRMTNSSPRNTRPVTLYKDEIGVIYISVNSLKSKKAITKKNVNVLTFAQFVLGATAAEMEKIVQFFIDSKYWSRLRNFFQITIEHYKISEDKDPIYLISEALDDQISEEGEAGENKKKINEIKYKTQLYEDIFPHVDYKEGSHEYKIKTKKFILGLMISRFLEFINGVRKTDDRDSWFNKAIQTAPISIKQLFAGSWTELLNHIESYINLRANNGEYNENESIDSLNNRAFYMNYIFSPARDSLVASDKKAAAKIGNIFEQSFLNNRWGKQKSNSQDDGRTEMVLQGESLLKKISNITKINTSASERGEMISARLPRQEQIGYVGISETPESGKCGLRRHKAITCWISVERDDSFIEKEIRSMPGFRNTISNSREAAGCLLNGVFIGWCDGAETVKMVKKRRRKNLEDKDISAVYDEFDGFVYVHTDDSRPTRPLLVVNASGRLVIDENDLWDSDFTTLLRKGAVEYVDSWELDNLRVAMALKYFYRDRAKLDTLRDTIHVQESHLRKKGQLPESSSQFTENFYEQQIKILKEKQDSLIKERNKTNEKILQLKEETREIVTKYEELLKNYTEAKGKHDLYDLETEQRLKDALVSIKEFFKNNFNEEFSEETSERLINEYKNLQSSLINNFERLFDVFKNKQVQYEQKISEYRKNSNINQKGFVEEIIKRYAGEISRPIATIDLVNKIENSKLVLKTLMSARIAIESVFNQRTRYIIQNIEPRLKQYYYREMSASISKTMLGLSKLMNQSETNVMATKDNTLIAILSSIQREITSIFRLLDEIKEEYNTLSIEQLTDSLFKDEMVKKREFSINTYKKLEKMFDYSYVELDPNAIFGYSASLLPAINHNEGVRNSYAASMNKQALSATTVSDLSNFSKSSKRLAYPEQPIFKTRAHSYMGFDENPTGQNVKLAIMDWKGYNQEDSIVLNKAAVDLGLFTMVITKSHFLKLEKIDGVDIKYVFGKPPNIDERKRYLFDNIDERGVARVGSVVNFYKERNIGDVIIARYTEMKVGNRTEYKDASLYCKFGQDGVIDRAFVTADIDKMDIATVRIVKIRNPIVGDKFASRSAQKSVVSFIAEDTDMPFTAQGTKPDIIMHPMAIPTRMTVNQLYEMIASKHGVLEGTRVDASGFRDFMTEIRTYEWTLVKNGYQKDGHEIFFDGETGEVIEGSVYFTPCFYQALRHHVSDKIQYRAQGIRDPMTFQPPGGRETGSGLRFGEMENAALISYGAKHMLRDMVCKSSTEYEAAYCMECNSVAERATKGGGYKLVCGVCEKKKKKYDLGRLKIPFILKTFADIVAMSGVKMNLRFKRK